MKVLTVMEPGRAEFSDVEKPKATGRMLLVKVKRTGICATDYSIYTGECSFVKSGDIKYPVRFGHEWSGIIEEVGEDVKNFKVGDRVFSDSGISCGECENCKAGDYGNCKNDRSVGTINAWDGPFAEYMLIPEYNAYKIPENVSYDEAALIEPIIIFTSITLLGFLSPLGVLLVAFLCWITLMRFVVDFYVARFVKRTILSKYENPVKEEK